MIVVFLEASQINQFLGALDRTELEQQFQIIASDEWGLDPSVVDGVESIAESNAYFINVYDKYMTNRIQ